jgi:hypothetical protein
LRFTTLRTLRFTTLGESYLDITLQNVLWAALGLAGTTALAILVTRLVNWVLDRRSALVVEVRANDVFNSKKLLNDLKEDTRSVVTNWQEQKKLPFDRYDKYTKFFVSEKYLKIAATNKTPKKLTGLTMSLYRGFCSLLKPSRTAKSTTRICGKRFLACLRTAN